MYEVVPKAQKPVLLLLSIFDFLRYVEGRYLC